MDDNKDSLVFKSCTASCQQGASGRSRRDDNSESGGSCIYPELLRGNRPVDFVSLFSILISGTRLTQRRFSAGGPWRLVHLNGSDGCIIALGGSIAALRCNHSPRAAFLRSGDVQSLFCVYYGLA